VSPQGWFVDLDFYKIHPGGWITCVVNTSKGCMSEPHHVMFYDVWHKT